MITASKPSGLTRSLHGATLTCMPDVWSWRPTVSAVPLVEPILLAYVTRMWGFAIGLPLSCAVTPSSQGLSHNRREGRRSLLLRPNGAAAGSEGRYIAGSEGRYIAPCRAAVEEYYLCQG